MRQFLPAELIGFSFSQMKSPAFQFYANDFLHGTAFFTAAQTGGFIRLLCHQWGHGAIPDDARIMRQLTGCTDEDLAFILQKFTHNADGLLENRRLEAVRREQKKYARKQAANAKARWGKELHRPKSDAKTMPPHMPLAMPKASQTPSQNDALQSSDFSLLSKGLRPQGASPLELRSTRTRGSEPNAARGGVQDPRKKTEEKTREIERIETETDAQRYAREAAEAANAAFGAPGEDAP